MTLSCMVVIVIFGYSNVYFLPYDRKLEFFNEFTILTCLYNCYLFTDYVPSPETRFIIGYSMIVCTMFNFAVNATLMVIEMLK